MSKYLTNYEVIIKAGPDASKIGQVLSYDKEADEYRVRLKDCTCYVGGKDLQFADERREDNFYYDF